MTRLLNANFARLFKGKLFWICAGAAVVLALTETIVNANKIKMGDLTVHPEAALFKTSGLFLLVITAILAGIFVGAEHGGALRNKIISGQKRVCVFLANAITCSAAIAMIHFLFVATVLLSGLILGGKFSLSFGEIALCEILQLASLFEMSVIFSAISLLRQQKIGGALVSFVTLLVLFALNFLFSVNAIKYSQESLYDNIPMERVERQNLSAGEQARLTFFESIQDINPFGQQTQIKESFYNAYYEQFYSEHFAQYVNGCGFTKIPIPTEIAFYSLGTIAVTTAVGALVFRKIDIK